MAKVCSSNVKISGLAYIYTKANKMYVCAGQPADQAGAAATATNKIASWSMTTGTGTDYQLEATGTGMKIIVDAQASLVPDATVVADHIALACSSAGSTELIYVTTCGTQLITSTANKINVSSWTITIGDAT